MRSITHLKKYEMNEWLNVSYVFAFGGSEECPPLTHTIVL